MSGIGKYESRADRVDSLLCVGLDPEVAKLPERFRKLSQPQFEFNKWIIEQTHEHVAAYKLNSAFYETRGAESFREMELTVRYIQENHPDIFLISDAKRGDIGNTSAQYAVSVFDHFGFDAATVNPYAGLESLKPFLDRKDKTTIILCRTSNPGAKELQDLLVGGKPVWKMVAENIRDNWNSNENCALVVGATYPAEMRDIRALMGDTTFLMPGIGKQGGSVEEAVTAGLNSKKKGAIINSSRGIIFSDDPGAEARKLKEEINRYRHV